MTAGEKLECAMNLLHSHCCFAFFALSPFVFLCLCLLANVTEECRARCFAAGVNEFLTYEYIHALCM